MGLSNYPPGVTGNEYAIGGAQSEWEAEAECPTCGTEGVMPHEYHYEFGTRAFCTNDQCPNQVDGFEIEPEERDDIDRYGTPEHEAWLIEMERQEG